jgi:hypothetical protein
MLTQAQLLDNLPKVIKGMKKNILTLGHALSYYL